MEYLQLTWSNWSYICDLIPKENFITGVYLDDNTKQPLDDERTSNTLGLYIKLNGGKTLVKEGEFIIKDNNSITILTELQFNRKQKLEKINKI